MRAQIEWQGGLRFKGSVDSRGLVLDGDSREGCSPMETLMMALAGCMAIDIVHILGKMHGSLRAVRTRIEGQRTETEPRRFTRLALHFEVEGTNLQESQVERAIALSREKYCSVWHSLDPGIERNITYQLTIDD